MCCSMDSNMGFIDIYHMLLPLCYIICLLLSSEVILYRDIIPNYTYSSLYCNAELLPNSFRIYRIFPERRTHEPRRIIPERRTCDYGGHRRGVVSMIGFREKNIWIFDSKSNLILNFKVLNMKKSHGLLVDLNTARWWWLIQNSWIMETTNGWRQQIYFCCAVDRSCGPWIWCVVGRCSELWD